MLVQVGLVGLGFGFVFAGFAIGGFLGLTGGFVVGGHSCYSLVYSGKFCLPGFGFLRLSLG